MFSQLQVIWSIMRAHRLRYGLALACLVVATVINFSVPLVGSATIDYAVARRVVGPDTPPLIGVYLGALGGADFLRANLWVAPLAMVVLTALSGLFSYVKGWQAALASDGIARRLKDELYDHLNHLPSRPHDRADTGDLVQRCTSDVETTRQFLASQVMEIGNALFLAATALPLLFALHVPMTLVSFALIIPITVYAYIYFRRVQHVFKEVEEAEGALTAVIQENLTGIRVVGGGGGAAGGGGGGARPPPPRPPPARISSGPSSPRPTSVTATAASTCSGSCPGTGRSAILSPSARSA